MERDDSQVALELVAALVARLGGYVTVSEAELEAAREAPMQIQRNIVTNEIALLLRMK